MPAQNAIIPDLKPNHAALAAGLGFVVMMLTAPVAEFVILPQLIVEGDINQTVANLSENRRLHLGVIIAHTLTYLADIVVAWGLFYLLRPVNAALSMLTMIVRLIYTAMSFVALTNQVEAFRLIASDEALTVLGAEQFATEVYLLVNAHQFEWNYALGIFGLHLLGLGYLSIRASNVPAFIGWILVITGLSYLTLVFGGYAFPDADFSLLTITGMGEFVLMIWLLAFGSRLKPETTTT